VTRQDLCDLGYEDVIVFENEDYDGCIVGVTTDNRAVYSKQRMVEWYMEKYGCDEEQALEWIDYNTVCSIGFEGSPIILGIDEPLQVCYNVFRRFNMNKIKEFFEKKVVIVIEGILIAIASAGLISGGLDAVEQSTQIAKVTTGIFTAIEALITIIQGFTKKKE